VAHGAALGLVMTVTPSGTPAMTDALVGELARAGVARLAVSLDAPDAASHDAFRGVDGSFAESLRILRAARACGVPTQINTSVGPHNARALRPMADLCAGSLGVALWAVFLVVPTGRAGASLLMRAPGVERLLEELADIAATAPFDVKTTAAPHFRRVLLQRKQREGARGVLRDVDERGVVRGARGITDGVGFVFVSHRGEIFPSGFLPQSRGRRAPRRPGAVYRTHPLFTRLRDADALGGKCGACPFRRVCGGSRARAWAMRGDVMAEDPLCAYVPKGYEGLSG
jgi:MoaA/NifB/PqqE/SkfB family radical SAM enzyme